MTASDEFLDQMRQAGDPLADDVVTALYNSGKVFTVWNLMKTLGQNDQPLPAELPRVLTDYLETTSHIPPVDPAVIRPGQDLFQAYGAEIIVVLAFYSLPASYAARKGVQVLYRTGYLNNRANYRVFETTQMVMDVLSPGGLDPGSRGVRSAQKVRLMHAATRNLIVNDPERVWPEEYGTPINQEDLAGTLMVFTHIILDGLDRLGIVVTAEQQQSFLEVWKVVARLMGIREELIPATPAEAKILCERIQQRQIATCPEGKEMTAALLEMLQAKTPPGFGQWPVALMRFFLPPAVADGFGLPGGSLDETILQNAAASRKELDPILGDLNQRLWLVRRFALGFLNLFTSMELGGKRTPFILPTSIHHGWVKAHIPGIWQQLKGN